MPRQLFTSESVSEGHPDKVCDAISDAVLDEALRQDPRSRVACETMVKSSCVVIAGEVTTRARLDFRAIARRTLREIGYTDASWGIDADTATVIPLIEEQSPDIARGVSRKRAGAKLQGAGDQGLMFGYASRERRPELMPLPIMVAHDLMRRQAKLRKSGALEWLRPDAKSQVTVEYEGATPRRIDAVVLSTQHAPEIRQRELIAAVKKEIIRPVLPTELVDRRTRFFVNPTGRFVIGGPRGDAGLTGRKNIVDTYGGMARHGGGAFSGKDPSKVDRSAAYYARYAAKNVVAARLAERCELQVSYAIGVVDPVSIRVESFGTGAIPDEEIARRVARVFDFRPGAMVSQLKLLRPIYRATAAYGHFGRRGPSFTWERTDRVSALR